MPPTEETTTLRVGADGETVSEPTEATPEVVTATIPGSDPDTFVEVTLAHPLSEKDRVYLGLPADASTEVGQVLRVNKNGAKAIINAGYATVDPEDNQKVRSVLRGETRSDAKADPAPADAVDEPTAEPTAEARSTPAENPPQAPSTPATPGPGGRQPGQKPGATGGSQPSAEGTGGK